MEQELDNSFEEGQSPEGILIDNQINTPRHHRLNVPLVRQSRGPLCGPASIEMVFRYWGATNVDQYAVARAIARQFRETDRYADFARHLAGTTNVDWSKYPGTGTYYMREFLERYGPVENKRIKELPGEAAAARQIQTEFFENLKEHLRRGNPVIVHQWWNENKTSQHYRVVTGYDDDRKIMYLNDPKLGRIEQNYDTFFILWKVEEAWLPFNSIVFNIAGGEQMRKPIRIEL